MCLSHLAWPWPWLWPSHFHRFLQQPRSLSPLLTGTADRHHLHPHPHPFPTGPEGEDKDQISGQKPGSPCPAPGSGLNSLLPRISLSCTCHAHRWLHKLTGGIEDCRHAFVCVTAAFPWTHTLECRPAQAAPLDSLPVRKAALPGVGPLHSTPNKSLTDREPLNRKPCLLCHQIHKEERESPFFLLLQLLKLHTGLPQA